MGVLRPRRRMVSLRLSEEEYQKLSALCARQGARSTSDMARMAISAYANSQNGQARRRQEPESDLAGKVAELQSEVRRLSRLMERESRPAGADSEG